MGGRAGKNLSIEKKISTFKGKGDARARKRINCNSEKGGREDKENH